MDKFKILLEKEQQKLYLKNIKPLQNQEAVDNLTEVLKKLYLTTEKFIKSGRDFEGIHFYAEEVRQFLEIYEKLQESDSEMNRLEKHAIAEFLENLSDMFAKNYDL